MIGKSGVSLLLMMLGFISSAHDFKSELAQARARSGAWKDRTAARSHTFLLVFLHAFLQSFEALTYRSQWQQGDSHRIRQF
ncbi:hypothetical protein [Bradyrhizobium sp. S69]|uniref:hypothetical protein n=1 Tax=Bradyrhizobium sp. S69 TaxID=1641856 RepID=UPI00131AFF1C|nr:hypothetical protein [Bradyrhizobium sp. S69]